MSRRSRGYDDGDDGYASDEPAYEGVVGGRPGFAPGDGFMPGEKPYAKTEGGSRSGRSGRGVDEDTHDSYGTRSSTARDGYSRDATSDAYEEKSYGYGDRPIRGQGYDRGYEQPAIEYGSRNRSQNDISGRDEYYETRRIDKRSRSRGRRDKGSGKSRDSSKDRDGHHDGAGNDDMKKWAATIAGAAAGGYAGHKAKKDNWLPAAVGAIVGGLVAREAEKQVYKRKERYDEEKNAQSMRRSKSR
jgi:hypothetical protein